MSENVGKTIKNIAHVCYVIGIILSVILGMVLGKETEGLSISIWIIGPLVLIVPYYLMLGFGEIIIKLYEIEENTRVKATQSKRGKNNNNHQFELSVADVYDEEILGENFDCDD